MNINIGKIEKIFKLIIVGLTIYSIFGLLTQFVFSFFNQSPYQESQLTLFNFALPCLITLGFMIYGSILFFEKPTTIKNTRITLYFVGLLEIISLKWQVEFFMWAIRTRLVSEIIPIFTGIIMTIYIFVALLKIVLLDKIRK